MDTRGCSKVSEFSRLSTYSNLPEGTTLTQLDAIKPGTADFNSETFVSELETGANNKGQNVRFNEKVDQRIISGRDGVPSKKPKLGPIDLKNRLYHRPENSQALKVVRQQEAMKAKEQVGQVNDATKLQQPVLAPLRQRPSSGRANLPSTFNTTMFKKDTLKKKPLRDIASPEMITLSKLRRMPSHEILPAISPKPPIDGKGLEERSASDLMDGRSEVMSVASDDTGATVGSLQETVKPEKKAVKFTEEIPKEDTRKPVTATSTRSAPGGGDLVNSASTLGRKAVEPSPLELASSFLPIESLGTGVQTPLGYRADMSTIASTKADPKSKEEKGLGKGNKIDPTLVFTYLKKNIYDDEAPESDNFEATLVSMRQRLGWMSELPRHGPGVREKMEEITDYVPTEDDVEASLLMKEDDGQFVYALPRNRKDKKGRYNPYDLECVSAHLARKERVYYTGTASNVTRVDVNDRGVEEMVRTPTMWWLWEKRLFDGIFPLPVFNLYLRWKTFHTWQINVKEQKFNSSRMVLTKTLFTANEVLQGCGLHVRSLCEAASSSLTGIGEAGSAISLVNLCRRETLTLDEFVTRQQQAGETALKQINALRDKCVSILWESCATVAEMEGITKGIRPEEKKTVTMNAGKTEDKQLKYKIKTRYGAIPVYEKKEKPKDKPSYAQISEWRKILHRLSFFLRYVDCLLLELLRRQVVTATKQLVKFVINSYNAGVLEDDKESLEDLNAPEAEESSRFKYSSDISTSRTQPEVSKGQTEVSITPTLVQFDFDKPLEEEHRQTIDEVLEEIERQNEVIEDILPIMSLQLVLRVPEVVPGSASRRRGSGCKKSHRSQETKSFESKSNPDTTRSRVSSGARKTPVDQKKDVTFQDEASDDSGSENEEDEDEETESETETETEVDTDILSNRFAYTNSTDPDFEKRSQLRDLNIKSRKAHIVMSPTEDQVLEGFRGIVTGFETTVGKVVSMLKDPKLAVFYSPPKHDLKLNYDEEMKLENMSEENTRPWPDTELLFDKDPAHQDQVNELMEHVQIAIDMVVDYSFEFDKYCAMVERSRHVNVAASMAKKMWNTEEFNHVLAVHTDQLRSMDKMMRHRRLGHIIVYTEGFCTDCKPYPQNVLTAVVERLPRIAFTRNEELLTIIKGASKKLDKYPATVEEFVEHLAFLGKMTSEMGALDKEFDIVTKLYTICKDFSVETPAEELALYQTLAPSFQHLKTVILYAEAKKEDNIRKFSSDLDKLIHGMRFKIINIKEEVRDPVLLHGDTMATTALEKITDLAEEVTDLFSKARSYANYQERFGSSMTKTKRFSEEFLLMDRGSDNSAQEIQQDLSEIERDLTLRRLLWKSQEEWDRLATEWTATPFDALNVEHLQKSVNRFTQTVYMLEKGLPHNEVIPRLKEKVTNFKAVMPCITSLRNPSLRPRHFQAIQATIGKAIERDKHFTLGNLLEMNIIKHKEKIQDISTTATNEATLERMLQKVIDLWQLTDFRLLPHVSGQVMIVAAADDIVAMLEESQVTVGTIRGSRYVGPIKTHVEEWERKLQVFSRTLDEWMTCQRNWLYLEQIFTTPDIQRQLPNESKLFAQVDKTWKDIMRRTEDRPNALKSATSSGALESLQAANVNLEKIQKCLDDYLETKRLVFPRFYFLSNEELLDILAQSKNPDAVQPHLAKCFGNIASLDIKQIPRQPLSVKTMTSAEGEVINMPKNVRANGPVEQWLGSVESGMFDTVKRHLRLGLTDYQGLPREEWVLKHPGQVVLTVGQIIFNKEVNFCFGNPEPIKQLASFKDKNIRQLNQLARLVSTNLVPYKRLSVNALLVIAVHNRDIMLNLIEDQVTRSDNFEWTRQLRYEWDEQSNHCNVLQSNTSFTYGYEYLGCSQRLVITPLTDRCYLTLTGAQHLHLGGSPAGPAGTGKTETVKDLAKGMGKQCVVFNCSEGIDFKMLGKFFSGMAQSGSWGCFDEFNRIDTEVLSVVAQQIHTVKTAKDQQAPRFVFEGKDIRLNPTCGIFITMNPTYAGRVELPDNLKALFRMVAMMVPDYALIAEIILFSEGFTDARSLSRKIVNLYQLASKQLSQQHHYDFGMRAIKSVLMMAGQRKRQVIIREQRTEMDERDEAHILIHSMRDANIPKFLAEDVPLFQSIMDDLFPGMRPPEPDHGALEKAVNMAIRDHGLQQWPGQIEKVKQLYNQILVRHGVMLVGPTGGGKTTVRNILQRALVLLPTVATDEALEGQAGLMDKRKLGLLAMTQAKAKKGHVETFTVNPKCVKLGELYGETDPNTFEWSDGLIATATRRLAKEAQATQHGEDGTHPSSQATQKTPSLASQSFHVGSIQESGPPSEHNTTGSELSGADGVPPPVPPPEVVQGNLDSVPTDWAWIVLDGPVDTIWVENLNTVLDDSKVLCLANGERISLTPGMRLLFEVDTLEHASPATVSRCAMVYMDPVELGWRPYVRTWLSRLPRDIPDSAKQQLLSLFEHSIDKGMDFVRTNRKFLMLPVAELNLVTCLCNILSAYVEFMSKNGGFGNADKEPERPPSGGSEHSFQSRSSSTQPGSRQRRKRQPRRKRDAAAKEEEKEEKPKEEKTKHSHAGKLYYMQRYPDNLTILLGKLFVFAYTWSYGGTFKRQDEMDDDGGISRKVDKKDAVIEVDIASEFDNFIRETFDIEPPLGIRLPASHRSMYGYFVDMDSGNFMPWDALIPTTQSLIEKGTMMSIGDTLGGGEKAEATDNSIVPTVDTVRYSFLAALLLLNKNPVLVTGESGTGKTAIVKDLLFRLGKDGGAGLKQRTVLGSVLNFTDRNQALLDNISSLTQLSKGGETDEGGASMDLVMGGGGGRSSRQPGVVSSMLQLSAQTSADRMVLALKSRLIKKGRDTLGAPKGKKVLVFVDDLNMPAPEEYGAQPPLELLRQFMDLGGYYDMKKLNWRDILDVTVIAACGPPGGGRNNISGRLLKHFSVLALPQPSTRSLQHIYQVKLGRFMHENEFTPDVKDALLSLVSAAIGIYYKMCAVMRPTPAKSHYTFNCRDLSQVIAGLTQADASVVVNSDNCAQLYAHEATRVFHDRLVNDEDRRTFFEMLADNLHDYFKVKWSAEDLMVTKPILFGDFLEAEDTGSIAARLYKPITDRAKLNSVLEELYMRQQMGNSQAPQLVFFSEAVEHVLRAARVFRQPGGHMLLVGLDGTGKQTVVHLAAYIADCQLFRLTLTRGYGMESFRDDLKKVCIRAGVKNIKTVFLLTDSDIVKEVFLEDMNCMLNSGEVPDLFDNEEMDGIVMDLKPAASAASIPDTRTAVFQFFIQRVQRNMHIVLAMSPAGSKFRQRCRMNPSLINCCTIDWFVEWSHDAMLSVARVYFRGAEFVADKNQDIEALKEQVAHACVDMHSSVQALTTRYWDEMRRRFYVTPSSYMELIRLFTRMLRDQHSKVMEDRKRLTGGLDKLSEAESLVGTMQEELVSLGPKIEEKARDTEVLLAQLEKDQSAVDQVREIVEAEEAVMQNEKKVVQDYADECQADLASVIPAIQLAIDSLNTLNKKDISELRVFLRPPALVTLVMSAVCTLLQTKPDWATAKQVLADPNFLQRLFDFDKNSVPEKVFYKLKQYTKHPDFTPEMVGAVSMACRSMCQWVLAMEHYHEVIKMAKPKQRKVDEAKEALGIAESNLAKKQASLRKIQGHLSMLQQQYQGSVNQREELKQRKERTHKRLQMASLLIAALSGEKVRWAESVGQLDFTLKGLVGDTLVSASVVAYLGAFTIKYRKEVIGQWRRLCTEREIPIAKHYDFVKSLASPAQVLKWQTEGLPQDNHSTENAIIVKNGRLWPLLIDPQGQGSRWIKEMEGSALKEVSAHDPHLMRSMERAIRVGEPVLLKEVGESLDPSMTSILQQDIFIRGGHYVIKIGDTEIEYNEQFRLYLSTNLSTPHYLPSVCIQVTIINFTVTFDGLQEQLLSSVVRQERPQLEQERTQLLDSIATDQQVVLDLENKTLTLLQKAQGHILDDQDLIQTLEKSKDMAAEIKQRIHQSEITEKKLNIARKRYLPVAIRGAVLYFVLADLAAVDVMYQFSLEWFQDMFISCISAPDSVSNPRSRVSSRGRRGSTSPADLGPLGPPAVAPRRSERIDSAISGHSGTTGTSTLSTQTDMIELQAHMKKMINKLTSSIYRVVSVALFANHQLIFSFMLCTAILRANAQYHREDMTLIEDIEWMVFLQGNIMASMMSEEQRKQFDGLSPMQRLECVSRPPPPKPRWLSDAMWSQCQHLETTFDTCEKLTRSILNCPAQWQAFIEHPQPFTLFKSSFDVDPYLNGKPQPEEMVVFHWEHLTEFQRLILIKVLKPQALTAAVRMFVEEQMGRPFVTYGAADLHEIFEQSDAKTPLIFLLSPGSDPSAQLHRFARELRGSTLHLDMISLGRGQGPKAEDLISKAQILKGRWIFLQNCHLAASWMPRLQTIVESFHRPGADVDPQFRLFLSSKPDPSFPISILQMGQKMTVEPPQGVKANLQRTLVSGAGAAVGERLYESVCPDNPDVWRNLLVGLCFFNALLHERKKYGRLGWNIPYEFNDSDLEVSLLQLQLLLEDQDVVPWPALWYLTGEVTFGGRVTDDWDRRCLHSLMRKFYTPNAMRPEYSYTQDKVYRPVAAGATYQQVKEYIEGLPVHDSPDLFGMDMNAEKAYLELESDTLVSTVLSVQPRLTSGLVTKGKSSDDLVVDLCSEMLRQIPHQVQSEETEAVPGQAAPLSYTDMLRLANGQDLAKIKRKLKIQEPAKNKKDGEIRDEWRAGVEEVRQLASTAMFTVMRQEIDRFNVLLRIIHKSLVQLIKAVKGEVVMSDSLEEAYNALLHQRVPVQWKNASYESTKPLGPWTRDLIMRVDFFNVWSDHVVNAAQRALKPTPPAARPTAAPRPASFAAEAKETSAEGATGAVQTEGVAEVPAAAALLTPVASGTNLDATGAAADAASSVGSGTPVGAKGGATPIPKTPQEMMEERVHPRSYWLPAFFFPQGFLSAVLQNHARRWGMSVDSLKFNFDIQSAVAPGHEDDWLTDIKQKLDVRSTAYHGPAPPQDGVLVHGLFIDGARWDGQSKTLGDSLPGQRFYRLPETHFIPVSAVEETSSRPSTSTLSVAGQVAAMAAEEGEHLYEAPLYRTSARAGTLSSTGHSTNFVTALTLPSTQLPDYWVMRGVALLCGLDY